MNWEAIHSWIDLAALLLSVGAWIYAWRVHRGQARHAEIESLKTDVEAERSRRRHDVEELRDRMTRAEARIDDSPTGGALHELALAIKELAGDVKVLFSRLDGMDKVVKRLETVADRQEEFLLRPRS